MHRSGLLLITLLVALNAAGSVVAAGLPASLVAKVVSEVDGDASRLITLFKDLHQNPELSMMEARTAGIVARELTALGYEVKTEIGGTGVVGVLHNGDGPVVMYRADMDANAVEEATGLPYASTRFVRREDGESVPVSHMCGHDAHTTWLISVAKTLAALKDAWRGTLVLLAQPAEETLAGAKAMVSDGLFTTHGIPKPDYLLAQHTTPFRQVRLLPAARP
jgi:hippurate hydrolase